MKSITKKYQTIVAEIFHYYADWRNSSPSATGRNEVIIDKSKQHFLLVSLGWQNERYDYFVNFHFEVINGKIWVIRNNTDTNLTDDLLKREVPYKDIIIAWHKDAVRELDGYYYGHP